MCFFGSGSAANGAGEDPRHGQVLLENDAIIMADGVKRLRSASTGKATTALRLVPMAARLGQRPLTLTGCMAAEGETIIYQDTIAKAGLAPPNPFRQTYGWIR